ncbi:hypothetical protein C1646_725535 [Rhizophagus diaphanus]|nr:hypothetical protein C1646_725535 [Rhizophagus diaphanus] [Rhizophagus sp. MUCL 43196]
MMWSIIIFIKVRVIFSMIKLIHITVILVLKVFKFGFNICNIIIITNINFLLKD